MTQQWASKSSYSTVTDGENSVEGENGLLHSSSFINEGGPEGELAKLWGMVADKWINLMLVFVPAGFIVTFAGCSETVIFIVNFIAMVVSKTCNVKIILKVRLLFLVNNRVYHSHFNGGERRKPRA